jgi:4'-phosphopantetheinyl transferase
MRGNELHVWRVELGVGSDEGFDAVLSQAERHRAQQFRFEDDRRRYAVAHVALRRILADYLGTAAAGIAFSATSHGKPELVNGSGLQFNLSHSGEQALVAVTSGRRVGIDIERHRDDLDCMQLARRFFSKQEIYDLEHVCASSRARAFFDCWTRKEAYVKAIGHGLSHPLETFSVPLRADLGQPFALLDSANRTNWRLWALRTNADYSAAVVTEGSEIGNLNIYAYADLPRAGHRGGSRAAPHPSPPATGGKPAVLPSGLAAARYL